MTPAQEDAVPVAAESVAAFAALLADRTRASVCLALLDGRAWTLGELAAHVGVARSTASEHLSALVGAGVLVEHRQGRHRYVALTGPEVAQLLEDLGAVAGTTRPPTSLRTVRAARDLAAGRTCYDHLAGALGVAVFDALCTADLVTADAGLALTPAGRAWFADLGCPTTVRPSTRRPLLRTCLDWTERRPHLAGSLGAALHLELLHRGWTRTTPASRAVALTTAGRSGLPGLLPGLGDLLRGASLA